MGKVRKGGRLGAGVGGRVGEGGDEEGGERGDGVYVD